MAIRPPVQVRHKHAMASVAHVQLAQRAVSQTPSGKKTLRQRGWAKYGGGHESATGPSQALMVKLRMRRGTRFQSRARMMNF